MAAAVTLHGFNSLKWSVTHTFFSLNLFICQSSADFEKTRKKNQCWKFNYFGLFYPCAIESCQNCGCQASQIPSLNIRFTLRDVTNWIYLFNRHSSVKFGRESLSVAIRLQHFQTNSHWGHIKLCYEDQLFKKFRCSLIHLSYFRNEVGDPQFCFCISDISN